MKIVLDSQPVQIEIEKSKFITHLFRVHSLQEAKEKQKEIKKLHPSANHHCLAVRVDDIEYASDDGEPAMSAGQPMLQTLIGHDINEVCAIVTRYFGGTLLGRGGLIRAYGQAVSAALEQQEFYTYQLLKKYRVTLPYDLMSIMETKLENKAIIQERDYAEQAIFYVDVLDESILEDLIEMTNNQISLELLGQENKLVKL